MSAPKMATEKLRKARKSFSSSCSVQPLMAIAHLALSFPVSLRSTFPPSPKIGRGRRRGGRSPACVAPSFSYAHRRRKGLGMDEGKRYTQQYPTVSLLIPKCQAAKDFYKISVHQRPSAWQQSASPRWRNAPRKGIIGVEKEGEEKSDHEARLEGIPPAAFAARRSGWLWWSRFALAKSDADTHGNVHANAYGNIDTNQHTHADINADANAHHHANTAGRSHALFAVDMDHGCQQQRYPSIRFAS